MEFRYIILSCLFLITDNIWAAYFTLPLRLLTCHVFFPWFSTIKPAYSKELFCMILSISVTVSYTHLLIDTVDNLCQIITIIWKNHLDKLIRRCVPILCERCFDNLCNSILIFCCKGSTEGDIAVCLNTLCNLLEMCIRDRSSTVYTSTTLLPSLLTVT